MDNPHKERPLKSRILHFRRSVKPMHFAPESNIPSDVFGSYTGTPLQNNTSDNPDLFPVQDADDL